MTSDPCTYARDGSIAVLTIDNPPVNSLATPVRRALLAALARFAADEGARAAVLLCAGRTFSAGAEISEFDKPPEAPVLPDVIAGIEACSKPVVAAIHGHALGGGLELALGCHYRVAAPGAKLGLPEVKLGLMPGAGGTQRLPRLVGQAMALEIAATGVPVSAETALAGGLLDRIVEGDLAAGAVRFAAAIADGPVRRTSEQIVPPAADGANEAFMMKNARRFRGFDAPPAIARAIELSARLPLEEGLEHERASFLRLREGPQSAALRHLFRAERAAAKPEGIDLSLAREIRTVGIVGAGTMGRGIALAFLSAGLPVTLVERDPNALARARASIAATLDRNAEKGRMTRDEAERGKASLVATDDPADLACCDLAIEAAFEDMDTKRAIFAQLGAIVRADAILATNTSYLDIDRICEAAPAPSRSLGLHFFSPANVMKLVEVVRGARTAPGTLATAIALARRLGKVPVLAGNCHGFIGNRMLAVRRREAEAMIAQGARPAQVDGVLEAFGFPMGPFRTSDLAGLDLGWNAAASSGATIRERLCEAGRRGQKAGKGFYDYDPNGRPLPSDEVDAILHGWARDNSIPQRSFDDDEIRARLLWPMVNEGARLLDEGNAASAADIDVVWVNGYGFPAYRGGPMHHAAAVGLGEVCRALDALGISPSAPMRAAAKADTFGALGPSPGPNRR